MRQKSENSLMNQIRDIVSMLFSGDFHGLLLAPTENGLLKFCRYCFVGGVATIVDWGVLYLTESLGVFYLLAAVAGFFGGLVCNYAMSKFMVFNGNTTKMNKKQEFIAYAAIGAAGLGITLVLMYLMTEWLGIHFMVSKIVATVLVLIWNYLARKIMIYQS